MTADGGGSKRATETTLPTCLFCSVKQNRKPLTDEANKIEAGRGGGGVYRKHRRDLEDCYHCQYQWCESEAADRSLDFQFICEKKAG